MSIFDRFVDSKPVAEDDEIQVQELPVEQIIPNTYQPRHDFNEVQINELAQSIQANGLLQPIIVRQNDEQKYEIIAGERRFRAIQRLNWTSIPAIIREYTNQESAALALIENLQREDLNPIEEARAYAKLEQMEQLQQKDLARKLGKSQSYVANKLRLLKLAPQVQQAISNGQISQRHGRALLNLNLEQQQALLPQIINKKLTVKATEDLVEKTLHPQVKKQTKVRALTSNNSKLSINTLHDSIKLAQKNGAQFTYQEVDTDQEYKMIITVKKEDQHG
ncbi:nucleoid occlusion protein [Bombilactobacillus bombi]|uniref:Nucleoid occlusion protein n=1 Tax=Bombilactobacillus bombi TaxID=1303590 RepID=A0A3R6YP08_9LACO|nr:ParB/RepB/Spo0J family partition protein [Bombilactobacillus bombi]MCO6540688.1 ParB/RepB/Spo0J family partition protein [Lactobacillus sp.]RHW48477.1 nucleoid occlusion protein [Bombilactobacillus bombi]RHW52217.1 nucleoid occlusion protein [Bombilactobacillus bombi]